MANEAEQDVPGAGPTAQGQQQSQGGWSLRQIPVWQQYLVFVPTFLIPLFQGLASEFLYDLIDGAVQGLYSGDGEGWGWLTADGLIYTVVIYAIAVLVGLISVLALVRLSVPGRSTLQFLLRAIPVFIVPFILVLAFSDNVSLRLSLETANADIAERNERIAELERQLEDAGRSVYYKADISGGDEILSMDPEGSQ